MEQMSTEQQETSAICTGTAQLNMDRQRLEILHRRLEEFDLVLRQWRQAYPSDQFPPPDFASADAALRANGLSLGGITAANMRHVVSMLDQLFEPVRWAMPAADRPVQTDRG